MFGPSVTNGFRVPPRRTADIRRHATHVRRLFGLPLEQGFFPMGPFIESWTEWGITYDIASAGDLPPGVEACCLPEKGVILLSERTYDMACRDNPRARFTVIHELGHLALSHARAFHRETAAPGAIKPYEDSEWQANQFAAEFLMPLADMQRKGLTTTNDVMLEYHVSHAAAQRRVSQLAKMQNGITGKGFGARQRSKP